MESKHSPLNFTEKVEPVEVKIRNYSRGNLDGLLKFPDSKSRNNVAKNNSGNIFSTM